MKPFQLTKWNYMLTYMEEADLILLFDNQKKISNPFIYSSFAFHPIYLPLDQFTQILSHCFLQKILLTE